MLDDDRRACSRCKKVLEYSPDFFPYRHSDPYLLDDMCFDCHVDYAEALASDAEEDARVEGEVVGERRGRLPKEYGPTSMDRRRKLRAQMKRRFVECASCGRTYPAHPRHFPVRHGKNELGLDPVCYYCRTGTIFQEEWAFKSFQEKKGRKAAK